MKIIVTQEHIDAGKRDVTHCPIALAVRELFPRTKVSVHGDWVDIRPGPQFTLSDAANDFVSKFDNGFPVAPQELEIFPMPAGV